MVADSTDEDLCARTGIAPVAAFYIGYIVKELFLDLGWYFVRHHDRDSISGYEIASTVIVSVCMGALKATVAWFTKGFLGDVLGDAANGMDMVAAEYVVPGLADTMRDVVAEIRDSDDVSIRDVLTLIEDHADDIMADILPTHNRLLSESGTQSSAPGFTGATADLRGQPATVEDGVLAYAGLAHNSDRVLGQGWRMTTPGESYLDLEFDVPELAEGAELSIVHRVYQYSTGTGNAPVDIIVNGLLVAEDFDVVAQHDGSTEFHVDTWQIGGYLVEGTNHVRVRLRVNVHNAEYWIASIGVMPGPDYIDRPLIGDDLFISHYEWDDSDGDGDHVNELGEPLDLTIRLSTKEACVRDVFVRLLSRDARVSVDDSTSNVSDICVGQSAWSNEFGLTVGGSGQYQTFLSFLVRYQKGDHYYQQVLRLSAAFFPDGSQVPSFAVEQTYEVDDSPELSVHNNGNGVFESGECVRVRPTLRNTGNALATDISAELVLGEVAAIAPESNLAADFPDLAPGEAERPSGSGGFFIRTDDYSYSGYVTFNMRVTWNDGTEEALISDALSVEIRPISILCVNPRIVDCGTVPSDATTEIATLVRNLGSAPMQVTNVSTGCAAIVIGQEQNGFTVAPGDQYDLRLSLDPSQMSSGTQLDCAVRFETEGLTAGTREAYVEMRVLALVSDEIEAIVVPGPGHRQYPDIQDSILVWVDNRNGNADIYGRNLVTGKEIVVVTNAAPQDKPRVGAGLIAWEDFRNGPENRDVYALDIASGDEIAVATDPAQERLVAVDGRKVFFVRHDYTLPVWRDSYKDCYNLYSFDVESHATAAITSFSQPPSGSDAYTVSSSSDWDAADGWVVWRQQSLLWEADHGTWSSGGYPSIGYQMPGGNVSTLSGASPDEGPRTAGGRIFWGDSYDGDCQIWMWSNGSTEMITSREEDHGDQEFAVGGNTVVYNSDNPAGIYFLDVSDRQENLVALHDGNKLKGLRADGAGISWYRHDPDAGIDHIYVAYPFGEPPGPLRVPRFVIDSIPEATAGEPYDAFIPAADPDGVMVMSFTLLQSPQWLSLVETTGEIAHLQGTPPLSGEVVVALQVSDGTDSSRTDFHVTVLTVRVSESRRPAETFLRTPFPNPFNPSTTIPFGLAEGSIVMLDVYNLSGQCVRHLVTSRLPAGYYSATWNGQDGNGRLAASGVYLIRMRTCDVSIVRRLTLMR